MIRDFPLSIIASPPGPMAVVLIFLITWLTVRLVKVTFDQAAVSHI